MKKFIKLILVFLTTLTLCACDRPEQPSVTNKSQHFAALIAKLPQLLLHADDPLLNQFFTDPPCAGFETTVADWQSYDFNRIKNADDTLKAFRNELFTIKRDSLNASEKESYDILKYALRDDEIPLENLYYLSTNPLGAYDGEIVDPLLTLYFWEIRRENDAKSCINLLRTLNEHAQAMLEFEKQRQEKGYGITIAELTLSLTNTRNSLAESDFNFLSDSLIAKLEDAAIPDKEEYIAIVQKEANQALTAYFETLITGLEKLTIRQKDGAVLADLPDGKAYYKALIYERSGFAEPEKYFAYLQKMSDKAYATLNKYAESVDLEALFATGADYTAIDNPHALIEYFRQMTADDFPPIKDIDYEMITLPTEFGYLLPGVGAFYLVGALDDPKAAQHMMLNGSYSPAEFTTVAHEAYPGHMYQHLYACQLHLPLFRHLLSFIDYTEGYAKYIEKYITRFANDEKAALALRAYDEYIYAFLLQAEYHLHYLGEDIMNELTQVFGDEASARAICEQLQFSPGAFIPYFVGSALIEDLYDDVKGKMSLREFHTELVNHGAIPLNLLKEIILKKAKR